jgi:hypothetical protein
LLRDCLGRLVLLLLLVVVLLGTHCRVALRSARLQQVQRRPHVGLAAKSGDALARGAGGGAARVGVEAAGYEKVGRRRPRARTGHERT